jgi:hypothetical protein
MAKEDDLVENKNTNTNLIQFPPQNPTNKIKVNTPIIIVLMNP